VDQVNLLGPRRGYGEGLLGADAARASALGTRLKAMLGLQAKIIK
jgi:hypothetical protein